MKPQRLEVSFHVLNYMRSSCSSSFADPPSSLGLLSLPCSLSKSPCLLNSILCRPHVHTHRVAQPGAKASRPADWTHFKFLTICASRWPLVLVGGGSTFLSAFLTCSSRSWFPLFVFLPYTCISPTFNLGGFWWASQGIVNVSSPLSNILWRTMQHCIIY